MINVAEAEAGSVNMPDAYVQAKMKYIQTPEEELPVEKKPRVVPFLKNVVEGIILIGSLS